MNVWYLELYFRTQMSQTSGHKNYARETFRNVLLIIDSSLQQHNWAFVIRAMYSTAVDCAFFHITVYFIRYFS